MLSCLWTVMVTSAAMNALISVPLTPEELAPWRDVTAAGFHLEGYELGGQSFMRIHCTACTVKWAYPRQKAPSAAVLLVTLGHATQHELSRVSALRKAMDGHFPGGGR